ncbi:MAG TPA: hypothetical protein VE713_10445, partial [Pyrinomonadaceae bacterium]|nr:hypothetical protein [Pyrinomonadaceae bacterium]
MSVPRDNARFGQSGDEVFAAGAHACPACGARARRAGARYCSTCGQSLGDEYFPTDSLRASYRFERVPPQARASGAARVGSGAWRVRSSAARRGGAVRPGARGRVMQTRSMGGITATARAFATYALVPYL